MAKIFIENKTINNDHKYINGIITMNGKDLGLEKLFNKADNAVIMPVFGLDAEKTPLQIQYLQLAASKIRDGADGLVFGRNAIQVNDKFAFQTALCEFVKKGISPEEAVFKFNLTNH